jgi:aquaporin Z
MPPEPSTPRKLLAEGVGTFIVTLATVAVAALSEGYGLPLGYFAVATATALGTMAVVYAFGPLSGGHANPSATIAFALRGAFGWRRVPGYVGAQFAGSFAAAYFVAATLHPEPQALVPQLHAGVTAAFVWEVALTAILVLVSLTIAAEARFVGPEAALVIGGVTALDRIIGLPISGASMNPARTLAPIVVAGGSATWWIYVAGPVLGLLVGVALVYLCLGPPNEDEKRKSHGSASVKFD